MDEEIHEMRLPRKVIVGENILGELPDIDEGLRDKEKILIITGPNVFKTIDKKLKSGWRRDQKVRLEFAGEAVINEVERMTNIAESDGLEIILGVGGGRAIDVAKMTAYKMNIDFVSIPTAASHDGISSQLASIRGGDRIFSHVTKPPNSVIVDIDIILQAPKRLTASGVGDAISKIVSVRDWRLGRDKRGEYYGVYAAQLALMGADLVMENSEGVGMGRKESIRTLVEALISDGVATGIAGGSRPCSGSEHLFSHALDLYSDRHALHGEQCGVGSIMMAHLHGLNYEEVRDTLKKAGAPTNAKELGIGEKSIVKALTLASTIRPERYSILNEEKLDMQRAYKLAKETRVID